MPPRRDDWTARDLFARWGRIVYNRANASLFVELSLPYPDNKLPVLRAHFAEYGIHASYYSNRFSWARGGKGRLGIRYPRPQVEVHIESKHAIAFFASIGWSCGHPRRDAAMRVWKDWAERPRLGRLAL